MQEFIERILNRKVVLQKVNPNKLPLVYEKLYDFYQADADGNLWMIAVPREHINLACLRKQYLQMQKLLGCNCAIYLKKTSEYSKNVMINEGIAFILEGKELYLPFMGILLARVGGREIKPVQKISYLTQKMLLLAIYESWHGITVTKAAGELDVTKMSVSRCFDEIEYLEIPTIGYMGKSRMIEIPKDRRQFWLDILPFLQNPVIRSYRLKYDMELPIKGGISALCEYSLLEDDSYPTYIVTKKELACYKIKDAQPAARDETPGCIVQEIGYYIPFHGGKTADPLTAILSLEEAEKSDDRVELAINEILREYVW